LAGEKEFYSSKFIEILKARGGKANYNDIHGTLLDEAYKMFKRFRFDIESKVIEDLTKKGVVKREAEVFTLSKEYTHY